VLSFVPVVIDACMVREQTGPLLQPKSGIAEETTGRGERDRCPWALKRASRPPTRIGKEKVMDSMANVISSDQVERTFVYNAAGVKPGRIDDVLIDKLSVQVRDAVVEFAGFLGRDKDRCLIP